MVFSNQNVNMMKNFIQKGLTVLLLLFGAVFAQTTGIVLLVDPDGNEALNYPAGSTLYARVTDSDQNGDDGSVETLTIAVTSETETSGEALVLTETGPASGVFAGSMGFEEAAAIDNDGTLQVTRGDRITATYVDNADDFGNEIVLTDLAYYGVTLRSGALTASETWTLDGSPYLVTGDVTVQSDQTLTIEPGVQVRFTELSDDQSGGNDANRAELYVYGTILAEGTEADSIVFTSNSESPSSGDWYGIYLKENNASGSFQYTRIGYATYAIRSQYLWGTTNDTMRVTNSRIHHSGTGLYYHYSGRYDIIENNNFHDLTGQGIYSSNWNYSDPNYNAGGIFHHLIHKNTFLRCSSTSIYIDAGGNYMISRNKIDGGNSYGMELGYMRGVTVRQDTIQNKESGGILLGYSDYATSQWKVVGSVIKDNGSYGMYIRYASVTVDSNTISGSSSRGVYVRTNFERPTADTLRHNTIINNGNTGIYVRDYASPFVQYNDLYGHSEYDYYNNSTTGNELDARYNWWGEETTAEMDLGGNPKNIGKIYDYYDDSNRGFVNYGGWLDASGGSPTAESGTGIVLLVDPDGNEALNYAPGSTLYARVTDSDQNGDDGSVETLTIAVTSETEASGEALVLTETGPASGVFAGSMSFEEGTAVDNDGTLQVTRGDRITATYVDNADDFGNEIVLTDLAYYGVTLKSGALTDSETWTLDGNPYLVTGDITVQSDQTLTIEPGVEVRFTELSDDQSGGNDANRAELYVYGTILAEGTEADSIVFTSNSESPSSGDWYGIYLKEQNASGSFQYIRIGYATYAIRSQYLWGDTNDTTRVTNSRIHHSGTGLYNYYSGRYNIIENNTFHDLSDNGIRNYNYEYSNPNYNADGLSGVIHKNTFLRCDNTSINFEAGGHYIISQNKIDGGNGHGMELRRMRGVTVRQDTIQNKGDYGIRMESSDWATSQWKVVGSVIKDNGSYGMRIDYASVTVDSNIISGHSSRGVYIRTDFENPAADTLTQHDYQ